MPSIRTINCQSAVLSKFLRAKIALRKRFAPRARRTNHSDRLTSHFNQSESRFSPLLYIVPLRKRRRARPKILTQFSRETGPEKSLSLGEKCENYANYRRVINIKRNIIYYPLILRKRVIFKNLLILTRK